MKRCETVYVIGFSMGGLIAAYLAVNYPVKKLVLLSAAAYYVNPKQLAADIGKMVKDTFRGELQNNDLFLRYKKKSKIPQFQQLFNFARLFQISGPFWKKLKFQRLSPKEKQMGLYLLKARNIYMKRLVLNIKILNTLRNRGI